ncbi:hypothetical protein CIB84_017158 [Bambusicola thoracicus]|uniref:Uncharacterized protein n=1 Tax=Bambusicola thoracicus TaxID=9083 RepID=A0A2P4S4X1_BAMTH|nr:hypothetical protein CIB84_017158 [Bambusicola thoracicus]
MKQKETQYGKMSSS